MPRSPLAPSADGPTTPVRHRAVIAVTSGVIASAVGLVLLGIGSAAASTGPSPGPAAGPLPKLPPITTPDPSSALPSTIDTVVVDIGLPPLPGAEVAQEPPTLPGAAAPTPAATAATVVSVPPLLPSTGADPSVALVPAWLLVITGTGLFAFRRSRVLPLRVRRRGRLRDR